MATGRKAGKGSGIPNPAAVADPAARECLERLTENILYLLSNPFKQSFPEVQVLEGNDIMVERLGEYVFRVNSTVDVLSLVDESGTSAGVMVYNDSGVTIYPGYAAEVDGTVKIIDQNNQTRIIPKVVKPSADSLNPALVMIAKEVISNGAFGAGGSGYDDDATDVLYNTTGATLDPGDEVGTVEDEWYLDDGQTGFIALGEAISFSDGSKRIKARPNGGSGGTSIFPAKIVSKDGAFYNITKYENGIDATSTGTAKVYVLQLNFADTLSAGTWIMTSLSAIGSTGGGNVP